MVGEGYSDTDDFVYPNTWYFDFFTNLVSELNLYVSRDEFSVPLSGDPGVIGLTLDTHNNPTLAENLKEQFTLYHEDHPSKFGMRLSLTWEITTEDPVTGWTAEEAPSEVDKYVWHLPNNGEQHQAQTVAPGDLLIKPKDMTLVPTNAPSRSGLQHGQNDWNFDGNIPDTEWYVLGAITD